MKKIAGFLLWLVVFQAIPSPAHAGMEVTTFEEPEVMRAFCGKQMPYAFCLCAFQNQGCEVMNIDQERGKRMVEDGFRSWVGQQIEGVARSCIDSGSQWNAATRQCITCTEGDVYFENKCVSPEKAGAVEGAFCAARQAFGEDWRAYSGFAEDAVRDVGEPVQNYHTVAAVLAGRLSERQEAVFMQRLSSIVRYHAQEYRAALVTGDETTIAQTLTNFVWFAEVVPREVSAPYQDLFSSEDEDVLTVFTTLLENVPLESATPDFPTDQTTADIKITVWNTPYPQYVADASGAQTADTTITPIPDSYIVAVSESVVAELQDSHLDSLALDRAITQAYAYEAQQRLSVLQNAALGAGEYAQLQEYKAAEFERARIEIEAQCKG